MNKKRTAQIERRPGSEPEIAKNSFFMDLFLAIKEKIRKIRNDLRTATVEPMKAHERKTMIKSKTSHPSNKR
jgi:hypothetical protein